MKPISEPHKISINLLLRCHSRSHKRWMTEGSSGLDWQSHWNSSSTSRNLCCLGAVAITSRRAASHVAGADSARWGAASHSEAARRKSPICGVRNLSLAMNRTIGFLEAKRSSSSVLPSYLLSQPLISGLRGNLACGIHSGETGRLSPLNAIPSINSPVRTVCLVTNRDCARHRCAARQLSSHLSDRLAPQPSQFRSSPHLPQK